MWLSLIVVVAIVLALLGGVVVGGVFAVILIPIAVVILVGGVVVSMWSRATSTGPGAEKHATPGVANLPHPDAPGPAAAPATPDQLVDARQKSQ